MSLWDAVSMYLFLPRGFRVHFFACMSFCLCICSFVPSLVRGELLDPTKPFFLWMGELSCQGEGPGHCWGDRNTVTKFNVIWAPLEVPDSTLCTGGMRDWLAQGAPWPKRRKFLPWGKEASLMHCIGLRGTYPPTWGEEEAEVTKKERVTQKNTIRFEPWNCTLEF